MAPQAMVMKRKGIHGGAPSGERWKAGATISGAAAKTPSTSSPRAMKSCQALM